MSLPERPTITKSLFGKELQESYSYGYRQHRQSLRPFYAKVAPHIKVNIELCCIFRLAYDAEGKAIVKYNALKHGLLAKEVVVDAGDGAAESQEEFDALISDLKDQYKPVGAVEEILVEKVAVAYWRLRRAHRYETGLIMSKIRYCYI